MAKKRRFVAPKDVSSGVAVGDAPPKPAPKPVVAAAPRLMAPRDWRLLGVVAGIALLAYVNSLDGQFVYDDRFQILANPTLGDLANLPKMFTQSVWQFMNSSAQQPVGAYYRPLFNAVLIVNAHLFGTSPAGWHFVSILFHLAVTAGVYMLARRWALTSETAAAAALLFALHPTHVESVAWASGIPDPLAAAALVASLLVYERYYARPARERWLLAASVALALAAMFSKETAIVFPVFLGARELLDRAPEETPVGRLTRAVVRALPYGAAAVVYLAMRYAVLGFISKAEPKAVGVTAEQVVLTIPSVLLHYARSLVVPYPLAITYDVTYVDSPADPRFWGSLLAVVAILAASVWLVRRSEAGRRALVWLVLFLLPVLGLKAFNQDESLVHDRYLYIPSVGFCLLAAMALEWLAARFGERRERVFRGAVAAVCAVLLALTVFQNETWRDDMAMADQAIAHDPGRPFLYNYVGAQYAAQKRLADAETWYKKAIDLRPDYYDALSNLADVCKQQNRAADAEQYYARATAAGAPYYNTYYNLASVYMTTGRYDMARAQLERAMEIDPANADAPYSLGWVYDQQGDAAHAEQYYAEALRLKPTYPEPRINLAILQTKRGRYKDALDNLLYAQKLAPQQPVMLYWLGEVYLKTGRAHDALPLLTQTAQAQPQHPRVHTTLGLCYEALGDAPHARESFQRALQVAPNEPYTNTAREHLAKLGA